jgi:hypothetical protein
MGDRADRLNRRRQDLDQSQSDDDSSDNPDPDPDPDPESKSQSQPEPSAESASESDSGHQTESTGNIKDQYEGIYMFLPEGLLREFNIIADEADLARRRQSGERIEKIRHFEPMVVQRGLEKIAEADDDELEEWASQFDS